MGSSFSWPGKEPLTPWEQLGLLLDGGTVQAARRSVARGWVGEGGAQRIIRAVRPFRMVLGWGRGHCAPVKATQVPPRVTDPHGN